MNLQIQVKGLVIQVTTGQPVEDPHGQGFSAKTAEFLTSDAEQIQALNKARSEHSMINVSCSDLHVTGQIWKTQSDSKSAKFIMSIEELHQKITK